MYAVSIGRFHQNHVCILNVFRIFQDRPVRRAQIPAENQFGRRRQAVCTGFLDPQLDTGGAEHMAGLSEAHGNAFSQFFFDIVKDRCQVLDRFNGIIYRVNGFFVFSAQTVVLLISVFCFTHLNVCAVTQHNIRQIRRRVRAEDFRMKSLLHEKRQSAAMIDVSMTQDDKIDFFRFKRKRETVSLLAFAPSLKHTAVQQKTVPLRFDQMTGTGHAVCCTAEPDFHTYCLPS